MVLTADSPTPHPRPLYRGGRCHVGTFRPAWLMTAPNSGDSQAERRRRGAGPHTPCLQPVPSQQTPITRRRRRPLPRRRISTRVAPASPTPTPRTPSPPSTLSAGRRCHCHSLVWWCLPILGCSCESRLRHSRAGIAMELCPRRTLLPLPLHPSTPPHRTPTHPPALALNLAHGGAHGHGSRANVIRHGA